MKREKWIHIKQEKHKREDTMACVEAAMITDIRDSQCQQNPHWTTGAMYIGSSTTLCLAWFNRIGWCAVAWIPLIPFIPLPHLKLRRKNHCYLLSVIPSLNLQHWKSGPLQPKPLMCVLMGFLLHLTVLHSVFKRIPQISTFLCL